MPLMRRMAALDLFDAAVRTGRLDVLRAWLDEVVAFAEGTGTPSALALAEHGRALLAEGPAAEEFFEASLAAHARSRRLARPRADRTGLRRAPAPRAAAGRRPRAPACRPRGVRGHRCGPVGRTSRAGAPGLRGDRPPPRRLTATDLTAQERQVAALVRQGLSNRDVAAQLFVSPRTVDFHLRNVFSKLGVASRAELTALPLDL